MSVVKIEKHYCDVCKNEMPSHNCTRKCNIAIRITFGNDSGRCQDKIFENFDVCDDCMIEMGFNPVPEFYKESRRLELNLRTNIKSIVKKLISVINK